MEIAIIVGVVLVFIIALLVGIIIFSVIFSMMMQNCNIIADTNGIKDGKTYQMKCVDPSLPDEAAALEALANELKVQIPNTDNMLIAEVSCVYKGSWFFGMFRTWDNGGWPTLKITACETGETCAENEQDAECVAGPGNGNVCNNNGTCDAEETIENCPNDCEETTQSGECGDGIINTGEKCDGTEFGEKTCQTETGLESGNLACNEDCTISSVDCKGCGDGTCQSELGETDETCSADCEPGEV